MVCILYKAIDRESKMLTFIRLKSPVCAVQINSISVNRKRRLIRRSIYEWYSKLSHSCSAIFLFIFSTPVPFLCLSAVEFLFCFSFDLDIVLLHILYFNIYWLLFSAWFSLLFFFTFSAPFFILFLIFSLLSVNSSVECLYICVCLCSVPFIFIYFFVSSYFTVFSSSVFFSCVVLLYIQPVGFRMYNISERTCICMHSIAIGWHLKMKKKM